MKYLYIVSMIVSSALIMIRSIVYIQMDGYKLRLKGGIKREFLYSLAITLVLMILGIIYRYTIDNSMVYYAIALSFVFLSTLILVVRRYKVAPHFTKRLIRLITIFLLIDMSIMATLLFYSYFGHEFEVIMTANSIFILNYLVILASLYLVYPLERHINNGYIDKAKIKLSEHKNIKVIGITGSFGKTSIKNILYTILSQKYNVKCTPMSYNTPLGIALAVNKLEGNENYFIVEMGARNIGDIEELASIVHPTYGIITGVTEQHMSTFRDIDNIERTKYELYRAIPENGVCVFNGYNDITHKMYGYSNKNNSLVTNSNNCYIDNINVKSSKSVFTLHIDGEVVEASTILLGLHNIENILLACTLAYKLGMTLEEISEGIAKIDVIPHRLEVSQKNGITIIDDSYNANIKGVKVALDVLKLFDGRKIVASQGIVEGGKSEADLNIKAGRYMADAVDIALLIGKESKYMAKGLIDSGFKVQNIIEVKSLKDAKLIFSALLRQGDVLLITNDLPDNY